MTKIVYKVGDILETEHELIVHGCNAQGAMGSGLAKSVRSLYPEVYETYRKFCSIAPSSQSILGTVVYAEAHDGKIIANAITQENYGREARCYVDYDAIEKAIVDINNYAYALDIDIVALPLIGAGLGGGDWSIISKIIEENLTDTIPYVYTLDGKIPGLQK